MDEYESPAGHKAIGLAAFAIALCLVLGITLAVAISLPEEQAKEKQQAKAKPLDDIAEKPAEKAATPDKAKDRPKKSETKKADPQTKIEQPIEEEPKPEEPKASDTKPKRYFVPRQEKPKATAKRRPKLKPDPVKDQPIPGYSKRIIGQFTVLVSDIVFKNSDDPAFEIGPIDVLEKELATVNSVFPAKTLAILHKLLIWVEWYDYDDPNIGVVAAQYHSVIGGLSEWSFQFNKHPLKANNIEIIDMKNISQNHQPSVKAQQCVILHEICHAVHFHVHGYDNPTIQGVYGQAMSRRLYRTSKDVYGREIVPYAATNDREYFAEISCAYLDRLYYFPFNRDDLKEHDPVGYALMEKVWGTAEAIDKIKQENAKRKK